MKHSKTLLFSAVGILLFVLAPMVPAQTGETDAVENSQEIAAYFPEKTFAIGIVPDVPSLKDKLTNHRLRDALENEEIRAFFQPLLEENELSLTDQNIQDVTGKSVDELTDMISGPVSIGLLEGENGLFQGNQKGASEAPAEAEVLVIAEVGSSSDTLSESVIPAVIENQKKAAREEGNAELYEKTESMGPHTLHTLLKKTDDGTESRGSWAIVDGYFVLVSPDSKALLKKTVRSIQNGPSGSSVAQKQHFARAVQKKADGSEMFLFVDVQRIVEAGRESAKQQQAGKNQAGTPSPEEVMDALGLDAMQSATGTVNVEEPFTEMTMELNYSERKGILDMLAFQSVSRDSNDLLSLPPSITTASVTGFSLKQFWERAMSTLNQISPQITQIVNMQVNQLQKQYGVNLKEDIVNSLGNRFITANFGASEDAESTEGSSMNPRQLWAISIRDQQRLTGAINSLKDSVGQGKALLNEREYLGKTVYTAKSALMGQTSKKMSPTYTFLDGYMVMSPTVEPVEDVIAHGKRGDRDGFFEQAKVRKAFDPLPAEPASISYTNLKGTASTLMNQLKSGGVGTLFYKDYVNLDADLRPETIEKFVQYIVAAMYMEDQQSRIIWRLQHEK